MLLVIPEGATSFSRITAASLGKFVTSAESCSVPGADAPELAEAKNLPWSEKKTRPLRRRSCLKFFATRGSAFAFRCLAAIVHDEMQEEHQDKDAAEGNNNRGAGGRVE